MPESFFDEPVARVKLSAGTTVYRSMGAGPPVLLIHGYPETHACWHRIATGLAERYSVVAPDLPGYGDSDVPLDDDARFAKRSMAASLVEVMNELGHDRFAVVGHDRGARVAYRMALDHPGVVESLTVIDIVPTVEEWDLIDGTESIATFHWPFLAHAPSASKPDVLDHDARTIEHTTDPTDTTTGGIQ